jgi:hypothetical protein
MNPVHEDIVRYRECVRGVWNTYLRSGSTWDEYSEFEIVERALFELIALRTVRMNGPAAPAHVRLTVELKDPEVPIIIQLSAVEGNVVWGNWERNVHPGEVRLDFLQLFDWDKLGVHELAYVQSRVTHWDRHDELVGRLVLVEFRHVEIAWDMEALPEQGDS